MFFATYQIMISSEYKCFRPCRCKLHLSNHIFRACFFLVEKIKCDLFSGVETGLLENWKHNQSKFKLFKNFSYFVGIKLWFIRKWNISKINHYFLCRDSLFFTIRRMGYTIMKRIFYRKKFKVFSPNSLWNFRKFVCIILLHQFVRGQILPKKCCQWEKKQYFKPFNFITSFRSVYQTSSSVD